MNSLLKKKTLMLALALCFAGFLHAQINMQFAGRFSTGFYDKAAAEITAYDAGSKRLFITNGPDTSIKIVNVSNASNPILISSISIKPYGIDLTSVAVKNGIVAITVIDSLGKTENGKVVFLDVNGNYLNQVDVGPNPDMLTFTPDGKKILVANEGEPNDGYTIDPEGSVSMIDISGGIAGLNQSQVLRAGFTQFNTGTNDYRIKITGRIQSGGVFLRNSTVAEDLEPEYIAVSDDGNTAWVTCQENNCLAELNVATATFTRLIPLGFKNHNLPGNGLDASDQGGVVNITTRPVYGMYQPDAIASYKAGSNTFLVTANEGDARADWGAANVEDVRFGSTTYLVDTNKFGGAAAVAALKANTVMGRLNVSNKYGDFNNDGLFDSIFCFGARSFSIWNGSTGQLVWDSKDEFEQLTKTLFPTNFNASSTNNTLKNRSDDKGPEPEAITVGKILDSTYAFIGLERIGGVMIYNITNPANPYFVQYLNTRVFTQTPGLNAGGDLAPEGIVFIPANQSPSGKPMLVVSYETSGTVVLFEINSRSDFQLQVLHSSDMESSVSATQDAPNFAAIVDKLEDEYPNTVLLSSGDNVLPGPFLSSGEDPSLQTPLRTTAASYYAGNGNQLRPAIGRADIAIMNIMGYHASAMGNHEFDLGTSELNGQIGVDIRSNGADKRWIGAQFPFVSCNLNYSQDLNLSYLFTNQILRDTAFKTAANITANSQKRGIAPSVVIERNGQKIGIVGITTQILAQISSPGATSIIGPTVNNMPALAAIMQPFIDSLRIKEGINKIIVLSHLQQINLEMSLAPLLKGVDIIIAGGNHELLADNTDRLRGGQTVYGTYPMLLNNFDNEPLLLVNSTAEWKYVNRLVLDFDVNGKIILSSLDPSINGVYAADSAMVTQLYGSYAAGFTAGSKGQQVRLITNAIASVINSKDGNVLGKSKVFLEGRRNLVRTEETNLGNVSSDANLWYAQQYDPAVKISIKNGGGIRSAIGFVNAVGNNVTLEPNQANAGAGKMAGDISQLDVENSLRFNNRLVIVSANAAGVKRLIEHGISATRPGATPGQFPQIGGLAFSYDTTLSVGSKIRSLVTIDANGNRVDTLVRNGVLVGDTNRVFKLVTLNFLANPSGSGSPIGGDGYPFPSNTFNRVDLDTAIKAAGTATFSAIGSEQDAFAEYLQARHATSQTAYAVRDTSLFGDRRIQLLNTRPDAIFTPPSLKPFNLLTPANNASVFVTAGASTPIKITFGSAKLPTAKYKWKASLAAGSLNNPLLTLNTDNNGVDTVLTLISGNVDAILASLGLNKGDSVLLKWTVYAYQGSDSLKANQDYFITLGRNKTLTSFNLLNPSNNARVLVKKASADPIVISWEASNTATKYTWFLDVPAGNFATPVVKLNADLSGTDTKLSLTSGAIDAVAESAGVAEGDSILLKWTVRAYEGTDSLTANSSFNIKVVREKSVGLKESQFLNESIVVFPNPAKEFVKINTSLDLSAAQFEVLTLDGKLVLNGNGIGEEISLTGIQSGVYLLKINCPEGIVYKKVVKH
jgi:2',3'-cyclic-nucleotide 2'-phosphodiesterase / 3'-nucleotidase / 5'-nucleotidase